MLARKRVIKESLSQFLLNNDKIRPLKTWIAGIILWQVKMIHNRWNMKKSGKQKDEHGGK